MLRARGFQGFRKRACLYILVYAFMRIYLRMYICIRVYIVYIFVSTHSLVYSYINTYCECICVHTRMDLRIYSQRCVCTHIYLCAYLCVFSHKHLKVEGSTTPPASEGPLPLTQRFLDPTAGLDPTLPLTPTSSPSASPEPCLLNTPQIPALLSSSATTLWPGPS